MNNTPKLVISNSLTESPWENATVAGGDLTETITKLKAEPGGDIIGYGGSTLVRGPRRPGTGGRDHLFMNPTAIGAGMPVFGDRTKLRLGRVHPVRVRHHRPALPADRD
jgi:dihydrofolate reductase